jgi:hypothetical protein
VKERRILTWRDHTSWAYLCTPSVHQKIKFWSKIDSKVRSHAIPSPVEQGPLLTTLKDLNTISDEQKSHVPGIVKMRDLLFNAFHMSVSACNSVLNGQRLKHTRIMGVSSSEASQKNQRMEKLEDMACSSKSRDGGPELVVPKICKCNMFHAIQYKTKHPQSDPLAYQIYCVPHRHGSSALHALSSCPPSPAWRISWPPAVQRSTDRQP